MSDQDDLVLSATSTENGAATPDERRPQMTLFEIDESWREHWKGMPEFSQLDRPPFKTIYVHFETPGDMAAFGLLVEQTITMNTRSIWYPEAEILGYTRARYVDVSTAEGAQDDDVEIIEIPDE